MRLWVPFGRRRVVGVLVETRDRSDLPDAKLKAALGVIDDEPVFDEPLLELLRWSADYYRHAPGEVIAAALPAALRAGASMLETTERWTLTAAAHTDQLPPLPGRANRLRELAEFLRGRDSADAAELAAFSPRWRDHARELEKRGWISRLRVTEHAPARGDVQTSQGLDPTPEQRTAIDAIAAATGAFVPFLLHGVTGSGKTEVYLRAIETVVAAGEQALVLVPEIALTPQLTHALPSALRHRSPCCTRRLNDSERLAAWRSARTGARRRRHRHALGSLCAARRPGLIVVDEEHDPSYKQQEGFRYSARDLAIARAQRHGIPVVLGSATPSLESLARLQRAGTRARASTWCCRQSGRRNASLRGCSVIDLRQARRQPRSVDAGNARDSPPPRCGGQVLLYLNRRGYAPSLFCPALRLGRALPALRRAPDGAPARVQRLICHHCAHRTAHAAHLSRSAERRSNPWARARNASRKRSRSIFPGRSARAHRSRRHAPQG